MAFLCLLAFRRPLKCCPSNSCICLVFPLSSQKYHSKEETQLPLLVFIFRTIPPSPKCPTKGPTYHTLGVKAPLKWSLFVSKLSRLQGGEPACLTLPRLSAVSPGDESSRACPPRRWPVGDREEVSWRGEQLGSPRPPGQGAPEFGTARPPRCKPGLWGVRRTSRKS